MIKSQRRFIYGSNFYESEGGAGGGGGPCQLGMFLQKECHPFVPVLCLSYIYSLLFLRIDLTAS